MSEKKEVLRALRYLAGVVREKNAKELSENVDQWEKKVSGLSIGKLMVELKNLLKHISFNDIAAAYDDFLKDQNNAVVLTVILGHIYDASRDDNRRLQDLIHHFDSSEEEEGKYCSTLL